MKTLLQRIENDFAYHPPTGGKAAKHQQIRTSCHGLAQELVSIVPEGRELSDALRYEKLIPEDDPESIHLIVQQRKVKRAETGTLIQITRIQ